VRFESTITKDHADYASQTVIMRTYDDTFSGEKIYPGKVRCSISSFGSPNPTRPQLVA